MSDDPALARHVSDRLGYGPRPGDLEHIGGVGVDRWIDQQLNPSSIAIPPRMEQRLSQIVTLRWSPTQIFVEYGPGSVGAMGGSPTQEQQQERNRRAQFVVEETIDTRLLRAIESPRQLEESLTEFWFNHFNVFIGKDLDRLWTGAYVEEAIRPNVLGRFRDLLLATAKHPAMLIYLDNWQNAAPGSPGAKGKFDGLNENYAREVMELHTLGVDGGYTQDDVITLARVLTGWTIGPLPDRRPSGGPNPMGFIRQFRPPPRPVVHAQGRGTFAFDGDRHDFSDKVLLGRTIRGQGIDEGEEALAMLAKSPATARHLSFKLAQFFLADQPDSHVVDAMAKTFLASDGNIRAVLRVLFASGAFRAPQSFGTRFKTPYRFVVSAVRATGVEIVNFRPLEGILNQLGERPYSCLTPDGYKYTEDAWLNPDALIRRVSFTVPFARGNLPLSRAPDDPPGPQPTPQIANAPGPKGPQVDPAIVMQCLGSRFSQRTLAVAENAQPDLRAALLLGSPEFMRY